jgi:WhiB family transcriptional regulator, redox-sensing transcriptional regulator
VITPGTRELQILIDFHEMTWADGAPCAETDPEAFFPEMGASSRCAKTVCRRCKARAECLEYAMEHRIPAGIWGALTEHERRDLRRARREAGAA